MNADVGDSVAEREERVADDCVADERVAVDALAEVGEEVTTASDDTAFALFNRLVALLAVPRAVNGCFFFVV